MPSRDTQLRLRDILAAASKIVARTCDLDFRTFVEDEWMQDAVLRNLAVIGEAARHVPAGFVEKYPEVPWRSVCDMRNIVVHEYFGVDLNIIWTTIREDLPVLISQMKTIMEKEQGPPAL